MVLVPKSKIVMKLKQSDYPIRTNLNQKIWSDLDSNRIIKKCKSNQFNSDLEF